SPPVTSRWIERVYCVNKQFILVGTTKQGVKLVDIAGRTYTDLLPHDETGTDIFVRDILQNGENEYWFATEQGIFIYDQGTGQHTAIRKQRADPWALSDNAVYTLCKDQEGANWAGTYFGGINYYAEDNTFFEKFFPLSEGQAIAGNAVREICGDNMGNIWIGTEDEGLT